MIDNEEARFLADIIISHAHRGDWTEDLPSGRAIRFKFDRQSLNYGWMVIGADWECSPRWMEYYFLSNFSGNLKSFSHDIMELRLLL